MQTPILSSATPLMRLLEPFFPSLSKKEGKDAKSLFLNEPQKPNTNTLFELKIPSLKGKADVSLNTSVLKLPQIDLKPIDTSILLRPTRAETEAERQLHELQRGLDVATQAAAHALSLMRADLATMRAALAARRARPHT